MPESPRHKQQRGKNYLLLILLLVMMLVVYGLTITRMGGG